MNFDNEKPLNRLIRLRDKQHGTYLHKLLEYLDAPPTLPGLLRIAQNLSAIFADETGALAPLRDTDMVGAWKEELRWMIANSEAIKKKLFDSDRDSDLFARNKGVNPVLRFGATHCPVYTRLWERPEDPQYGRKFRVLQGQVFYASLAIKRSIAKSEWWHDDLKRNVSIGHLYNSSLSLKHIVDLCQDSEEYKAFLKAVPIRLRLNDFVRHMIEQRYGLDRHNPLYSDLGLLVSLLKWGVYGQYIPSPREQHGEVRGSLKKGPKIPEDVQDFRSVSPYILRKIIDPDDEEDTDEEKSSARGKFGIDRYICLPRTPGQNKEIIDSGDNPDDYLHCPSIDLAVHPRGVCLDAGGWREMENQHLPWTLHELADEELGVTLLRLENRVRAEDPQAYDMLALAYATLWTGRSLKDILELKFYSSEKNDQDLISLSTCKSDCDPSVDTWHIRALKVPYSNKQKRTITYQGMRRCLPIFSLSAKTNVSKLIVLRSSAMGSTYQAGRADKLFSENASTYKKRLQEELAKRSCHAELGDLSRVTFDRIGYVLFQRIVDLTGGDMVAASLITGRDIDIAEVDRFYASPYVSSLQSIYFAAVASIMQDLKPFNLEYAADIIENINCTDDAVGSVLCPTVETVKSALSQIKDYLQYVPIKTERKGKQEKTEKLSPEMMEHHNYYSLWTLLTVGWSVGFRAITDLFICDTEVDFVSGLTAFQDKGPENRSKTRLMALPDFVLAQIREYGQYLKNSYVPDDEEIRNRLYLFDENGERQIATPSILKSYLERFLLASANTSRHFGRTQWIEQGMNPEYISVWLGHFFRGEEPWGKYSTFRYADYCSYMRQAMASMLMDLGFAAIGRNGEHLAENRTEVESFLRYQKTRIESGKRPKHIERHARIYGKA
jgi:hypothetical protein